jgi:hypothetical protein
MSEPKEVELRGNVTRSFMQKLDACAQADGMGRVEWLIPIIERECEKRIQAANVLLRMLQGNPPLRDGGRE